MGGIVDVVLILFALISVYTDLKHRKVFNFTIVSAFILGVGLNYIYFGFGGVKNSLAGILSGFLFLSFFYLMGGVGAGDVKFMMAIGALKGYEFTIMGGIYGTILGGIFAIVFLMARKELFSAVKKIFQTFFSAVISGKVAPIPENKKVTHKIPYVIFLAAGFLIRRIENIQR